MNRAAPLAALMLLAAACTEEAGTSAERGGTAAGEVQGGTISDAMIPLEQLDSQAPLAPRQAQGETSADLDAEQPLVTPVEGVEGAPPAEAVEAEAAPAPEQPQQ